VAVGLTAEQIHSFFRRRVAGAIALYGQRPGQTDDGDVA
jgi:hypothetical protein